MNNIIAIIVFTIPLLLLTSTVIIIIKIQERKYIKRNEVIGLIIEITNELALLRLTERLSNYPYIAKYIEVVNRLLIAFNSKNFKLKDIKVLKADMANEEDRVFFNNLQREYEQCPKDIRKLVNRHIDLSMDIFIHNHMLVYSLLSYKQIARFLLAVINIVKKFNDWGYILNSEKNRKKPIRRIAY